ncbi:MAG: sporulation protein [Hamadaea sp.]|nr:sporulation protein [Hamadaea sp.]
MTQTLSHETPVLETVRRVVENAGASRVFGEPVRQDGVTVIPVAKVSGGGGGGSGTGPAPEGQEAGGSGGGVGIAAKPVGVFIVRDGKVSWRPAVDINKIIMGGQIVLAVALLTVRAIVKARARMS